MLLIENSVDSNVREIIEHTEKQSKPLDPNAQLTNEDIRRLLQGQAL